MVAGGAPMLVLANQSRLNLGNVDQAALNGFVEKKERSIGFAL